jgi:hypothetical protein
MEDGSVVLGSIELKRRTLSLSVNSAARGKAMFAATLIALVGSPLTFSERLIMAPTLAQVEQLRN